VGLEMFFFFIPSLYLPLLLFKHFGIVLGNIGENRGRYNNTEER